VSIPQSNNPEVATPEADGPASAPASSPADQNTPPAPSQAQPADSDAPPMVATNDAAVGGAPSSVQSDAQAAPTDTAAGMVDEASVEWNGEMDSLEGAEWFTSIPEKNRNTLLAGMKRKYKNLEGGFTRKTQEMADFRKETETAQAAARTKFETDLSKSEKELAYYRRFLDTGESPSDQLRQEAQELREKLSQLDASAAEKETALRDLVQKEFREKELSPLQMRLEALQAERDSVQTTLEQHQETAQREQVERNNQVLDELNRWVDENAPALWDDANTDALLMFESSLRTELAADPEVALRIVGAVHPAFDRSAAAAVPASVEVMNNDSTVSFGQLGTSKPLSYLEHKRQLMDSITKT
jgi:hypothetical protein